MSAYTFITPPAPIQAWIDAHDVTLPVLTAHADALQDAAHPDPEQLLLDLERYIADHPEAQSRYAQVGGQLAFRTAVELFTSGLREKSLEFYELSLRWRPDDTLTRYNYAVALHALCYRDAALAQYQELMRRSTPAAMLRVWVLAAQIHAMRGQHAEVVALLTPLASTLFPDDSEFWEALGNARTALGAPTAPDTTPSTASGRTCSQCGDVLKSSAKFCPTCGAKTPAASATPAAPPVNTAVCRHCGQPRRAGAKFCGSCGKA